MNLASTLGRMSEGQIAGTNPAQDKSGSGEFNLLAAGSGLFERIPASARGDVLGGPSGGAGEAFHDERTPLPSGRGKEGGIAPPTCEGAAARPELGALGTLSWALDSNSSKPQTKKTSERRIAITNNNQIVHGTLVL